MKPKKGEAHAEMDEPLKNPLQLVKELVLLIVEARTPDLSVKGRVEGPHCPVIRGRLTHKCSAEKSECVRASEFCYLVQRLWLNRVPICLDILLFPNCIHGQEEASVTEGTVTKLSQENALLAERWTIDGGSKRRQDDCLSSSMLIQAVRSYLHFSQISSWLYSTGGKLPGFLAYRVYAPGEVTSLDFLQAPDIHNFPVCLASFDHIRVTVSSLQRQASVPILVCLQETSLGCNSRKTHYKGNNIQQNKSKEVKVRTKHEQLKDFALSENYVKLSHQMTSVTEKTYVPAADYGKKYMKSLPEATARGLSEEEMFDASLDLTDLSQSKWSPRMENTVSHFKETSNRQTLSDADISRKKAKNRIRLKTSDGGDDSGNVLYTRNCIVYEDENAELSLNAHMNPHSDVVTSTPGLLERDIKLSDLEFGQSLLNKMVTPGIGLKNKSSYCGISHGEEYSGFDKLHHNKRRLEKEIKKERSNDLCMEQLKLGLNMHAQDQELSKHIREEEEYKLTNEVVDIQTLIKNKKKAEFSKLKKNLEERQPDSIASLNMWPFEADGMKKLPLDLLRNNDVDNIDRKKLNFPLSPKDNFHDGTSFHSSDKAALYNQVSSNNTFLATKKNNFSENEANEKLIQILSNRLSMIKSPQSEMFASPNVSHKFQDTEFLSDYASMVKNLGEGELKFQLNKTLSQSRESQSDSDGAVEEQTNRSVKNSKLRQLTFDVAKSSDIFEDSDDTPVASPNQTPRPKSISESLMKSVAEKSMKHNCQWLQRDESKLSDHETAQDMTEPSSISKSEFQIVSDSRFFAHVPIKTQELDNAALKKIQPLNKKNIESHSEPHKISIPGFRSQKLVTTLKDPVQKMQLTEQETVCLPVSMFTQCKLHSHVGSQNEVVRSNQAPHKISLESSYSHLSGNEKYLKENDHVNEVPMSEDHIICNQDLPQPCSRRFFEENLLPLVSYDADSDTFRKVEELYSSNILHSPKVLFSCDLPGTKVVNSRRCIDFGDTFEAEFFRSKISDLVNPEAIGKYMSNLATLSSSITNGKEDQDEDTFGRIKQVQDLVRQDTPNNVIEISSKTDCLLKHRREVNNTETNAEFSDLNTSSDSCLKLLHDKHSVVKEKLDQEIRGHFEITEENHKESSVNNGAFNQTRRQLNLSYSENSKPATIKKNKEWADETLLSTNVSLLDLLGSSEVRTFPGITSSKDIADSLPSMRMVSPSPPLSSSSSSSSSTSSIRMVSSSLSPSSPTASGISPASKEETFNIDKRSKGDYCLLDMQEPLYTYLSNVTAEQEDENITIVLTERKSNNQRQVQSDLKSKRRSSNNKESLTFMSSDVTFSVPSVAVSSSLHSTNISTDPLPSSILQSLPILIDATHKHLCYNDKNSHTSLSKVIIPQPLPHGDADNDHANFEPEAGSSCECQPNLSYLVCNQRIQTNDWNSQMVSDTEVPEHAFNLIQGQPQVRLVFDVESSTCNQDGRMSTARKGSIARSSNSPVQDTASLKIAVSHAQTNVKIFSKGDTAIANSDWKDSVNPSITTQPSLDLLSNKTPRTESVEPIDNNFSNEEFSVYHFPVASSSCSIVIPVKIGANEKVHEQKSETPKLVYADYNYGKQKDKPRHDYSNSVLPVPKGDHQLSCHKRDTDSLEKEVLTSDSEARYFLATAVISKDLSVSHEQFQHDLKTKENYPSLAVVDNDSRTVSQNGEGYDEIFHSSFVEQQADFCIFNVDRGSTGASNIENSSEAYFKNDHFIVATNTENMHQQHSSIKIIQTRQNSKNGFEVEGENIDKENDIDASDWNNDVVFYLSETESKGEVDPPSLSLLSNSLQEDVTPSVNYKAIRPSSLSAEVNLEMRLRSNPGIRNKSSLDFSDHSRSPPYHSDSAGWSSIPPHRTVSTPSCMDRETKSKEKLSSDTSVIQQHNCDHVSQTGLRRMAAKSASMIFNNRTGLPTQSSPAPLKRKSGGRFDYDVSLLNTRAIKNAFSCSKLASNGSGNDDEDETKRTLSTSAPASTNCLLGNFEESILNGRIDPVGTVDGFTAEIGASGSFCPKHLHLPVSAFFFALSDDNAPSPYLGHINLESVGKKGYHIPKKGTVQVTLFNPNKTVVKMFVVVYDLSDMPASSQTFIRQRTVYSPIDKSHTAPSYLRYLIHLRCASSHSRKIYLHTDIRLIFARHKLDIDAKTIPYELKSYTEGPQNPKYSPKK